MSILDRIVGDTCALVEERKREVPLQRLEQRPLFDRATCSLHERLCADELSVIAEIKKKAPSAGALRPAADVAAIAQGYARSGAAALSILTEPTHFGGALTDLAWVRAHVRDLPLLRKDFIIDPYQLAEAKAHGADAVLLIASVLEPRQLYDLHQAATEMGLDCLVEVYTLDELRRIDFDQVSILGVNNRDLNTFEIDLNQSIRVFRHVPEHVVRVSESGLTSARELATMRRYGVDAVLIGSALMRADDPGKALHALREETAALLQSARKEERTNG